MSIETQEKEVAELRARLQLSGDLYLSECKLIVESGDINASIKLCEALTPKYVYFLKENKAMLNHQSAISLDTDWMFSRSTALALCECIIWVIERGE